MRSTAWQYAMPFRLAWEERDGHRWAGPLAAVGLAAGAAMALFGLPPVDLHGPLHYAGVMGPLCGGTRAVHAAALGDLGDALRFNPLAVLLVPGAVAALVREAAGRLTGRWPNVRITHRRAAIAAAAVLTAALTVRQQTRADLLGPEPDGGMAAGLLLYAAAVPLVAALVVVLLLRRHRHR
ncbi:DUF2752 domain-containing protein [Streptomyces sp. YIM 98790]|uniref:DUF2752 domain-containing protein n=1 Tax=Streptomyces sp. YIM 98790 TaxID=2689077 RepID=UPI0028BD1AEF|nr:DUF2752 domain-containing protein [Streptomyces sp. YIM 98790]